MQIESEIVGCGSVQMCPESSVSWDSVSEVNKAASARRVQAHNMSLQGLSWDELKLGFISGVSRGLGRERRLSPHSLIGI